MSEVRRVAFYIDGYNLYHAIDDLNNPARNPQLQARGPFHHLKWLCLRTLAQRLIAKRTERLESVQYFSAWANHRGQGARLKQDLYIQALRVRNVSCIISQFAKEDVACRPCGHRWTRHVEKETDVGVALAIVDDAYRDRIDTFYVVSADTDLVPVYRLFKANFPAKQLIAVAPPHRRHPNEMLNLNGKLKRAITMDSLEQCLLPAAVYSSRPPIFRPKDYDPPAKVVGGGAGGAPPAGP